jgi:hypothetical protein
LAGGIAPPNVVREKDKEPGREGVMTTDRHGVA